MSADHKIREALRLAGTPAGAVFNSIICKVDSVDTNERTCDVTPLNGDPEIFGVLLQANTNPTGIFCVPTVGSEVIVTLLSQEVAFVSLFGAIDKVFIHGDTYPMIKTSDLVNRLNNIENTVNNMVVQHNAHTHASSGAPPAVPMTGTLTLTAEGNIANYKVKHGA